MHMLGRRQPQCSRLETRRASTLALRENLPLTLSFECVKCRVGVNCARDGHAGTTHTAPRVLVGAAARARRACHTPTTGSFTYTSGLRWLRHGMEARIASCASKSSAATARPVPCAVTVCVSASAGAPRTSSSQQAAAAPPAAVHPLRWRTECEHCARMVPQGSTIIAWPYVSRRGLCLPHWAAASTNACVDSAPIDDAHGVGSRQRRRTWFSIARARSNTSQCAMPVGTVNAAGTNNVYGHRTHDVGARAS